MKKYKVTQEFMDSLEDWRGKFVNDEIPVNALTHETHNNVVELWRFENFGTGEFIQRLGALLNWINGEDVFEIGKPKYIVQQKNIKSHAWRQYLYVTSDECAIMMYKIDKATIFDDFDKASEWANAHFEVVEVDE
jgi:hypothetical protein